MKRLLFCILAALLALNLFSCVPINKPVDTTAETTVFIDTEEDLADVTAPPETTARDTDEKTTSEKVTTAGPFAVNNKDEAIDAAKRFLGTVDEDTGYQYGFSFDTQVEDGGEIYYKIRVSWHIVEEDRFSLCGYLLVDRYGNVSKYNW